MTIAFVHSRNLTSMGNMQNEERKAMRPRRAVFQCVNLQVLVSLLVKPRLGGADPQDLNGQGCAHEYA